MKNINIDLDGTVTITGEDDPLTSSELKVIGMPYTLNGVVYQVPLTKDSQDTVVALSVAFQSSAITSTNIEFDNGTILPIEAADFMNFAIWFTTERNKFFQ
jgi:hypothetical protein